MLFRYFLPGRQSSPHGRPGRRAALLLGVILVGSLAASAARSPLLKISEYQKQDWQVEDGLPEGNVRSIIQTQDGMLLIATSGGMVSFDGKRFTPVKVDARDVAAHEAVNTLMLARNGDLWIGTDGRGIVVSHPNGDTVSLSEVAGFPHDRPRRLYQDASGTVWAATQNGVERIHDGKFELLKSAGMVPGDITTPFAEDGSGGMFFVTCQGLFSWRHGTVKAVPLQHAELGAPVAVYRDPQKRLWLGRMHGLMQLTLRGGVYEQLPVAGVRGPVTAIVGDQDGNLWVGTRARGIFRLTRDGSVTSWTMADGLPNDSIRSMYLDDEQNLWIGLMNGGMERLRKSTLIPYGVPEGFQAEHVANVLSGLNGDIWLGTWDKGLFRLRQGRLSSEPLPGASQTEIRALALDAHGQLWVGTWFNGLYRYDGAEFHHYLLGNESLANAVSAIVGDRRGGLWVGTYMGLLHFVDGKPAKGKGTLLLPERLITCLEDAPDGSMLVGTSTGLYRIREERVEAIAGLSQRHVLSISTDALGNTWVGTKAGGLDLLEGTSVRHLGTETGIPDISISSLLQDDHGFLWMGTTRGVLRVSAKDLDDLAHRRRENVDSVLYNKADGMRNSECTGPSQPTAARVSDGSLWFATAKGFVHVNRAAAYFHLPPPVVQMQGFVVAGKEVGAVNLLNLSPGLHDLVVRFNAKRLANPAHLEFRYRLDGYEQDWTETESRSAHYRRLPPGAYKFEVEARDAGSAWSGSYLSTEIDQQAFFYQTYWFQVILAVAACFIAVQLFRWRLARVKGAMGAVFEERNRIAREWHDTLMAEFAAISWQMETTARHLRESSDRSAATQSCELARSMVSHCQAEARRIIWDLRENETSTPILSEALSRALSANGTQDRVNTSLRVIGKEVPLTQGYIHHLVCIGQEAVTNALRHAQPKAIAIQLHYDRNEFKLSVKDDGCGFRSNPSASAMLGHFGIPVMEERARKLGGTLHVETEIGCGTEVVVSVPFPMPALALGF